MSNEEIDILNLADAFRVRTFQFEELNCLIEMERTWASTTKARVYSHNRPEASESCRQVNGKMTEEAFKYRSGPGGKKCE